MNTLQFRPVVTAISSRPGEEAVNKHPCVCQCRQCVCRSCGRLRRPDTSPEELLGLFRRVT